MPRKKVEKRSSTPNISLSSQFKFVRAEDTSLVNQAVTSSGTLTGIPRKVKDSCADWYNLIQQWNGLLIDGSSVITKLNNIKLESINSFLLESGSSKNEEALYPEGLQEQVDKLELVVSSMEKVVVKMKRITDQLQALVTLDRFESSRSVLNTTSSSLSSAAAGDVTDTSLDSQHALQTCVPVFKTWTCQQFADTSEQLSSTYSQELGLKQELVKHVAHTDNRDTMLFLLASWTHQPYIPDQTTLWLETMLLESGHR